MFKKIFLFAGIALMSAQIVTAAELKQEMDVSVGVFDAAKVSLAYTEANGVFDITSKVLTQNLFDTLYPFEGSYKSKGQILTKGVKPEIYETQSKTRSHIRGKTIFYDKSGKPYKRVSFKDKKQNTVRIDDVPETADAADLQSVFAELLINFKKTGGCVLKREVYDGKKHYNVIVADKGTYKRYFDFTGQEERARKCQVYIENLKENNDNILWDVSADKPINFWVGTEKKSKMPFILEIGIDSTPLGALKVLPRTLETK